MSYNYQYVKKEEFQLVKKELIKLINEVQDDLRNYFTFKFNFIGSASRNMITCDQSMNIGYDFDVDIEPNYDYEVYSAKDLRTMIINAFNRCVSKYGYKTCQESTRVFTIKKIDVKKSKLIHSADFAIIYNGVDDEGYKICQYIHMQKNAQKYFWQNQTSGYYELPQKIDFLKEYKCWEELRSCYLNKKNNNTNLQKKSRSLFAEAVNELANKYGYNDD